MRFLLPTILLIVFSAHSCDCGQKTCSCAKSVNCAVESAQWYAAGENTVKVSHDAAAGKLVVQVFDADRQLYVPINHSPMIKLTGEREVYLWMEGRAHWAPPIGVPTIFRCFEQTDDALKREKLTGTMAIIINGKRHVLDVENPIPPDDLKNTK